MDNFVKCIAEHLWVSLSPDMEAISRRNLREKYGVIEAALEKDFARAGFLEHMRIECPSSSITSDVDTYALARMVAKYLKEKYAADAK